MTFAVEAKAGSESYMATKKDFAYEEDFVKGEEEFDESAEAERRLAELKRKMVRNGNWNDGEEEEVRSDDRGGCVL
ncbi:hypothetical protein VNO78_00826 [Psophocarpus tetragonolobus]|uniref:Uncharacterized protein n=1 Tax=Psophocarpus tetragonolobus TaxID=3891 RepID=A0AAN9SXG3_PSOTE